MQRQNSMLYLWWEEQQPLENPVFKSSIGSRAKGTIGYSVFSGWQYGIQLTNAYGIIFEIQLGQLLLANQFTNSSTLNNFQKVFFFF